MAAKAEDMSRESPIRPKTNEGVTRREIRETSALLPMAETPHGTAEAPEVMATGEDDSEEDGARLPNTKKVPAGMTAAEWELHKLTHLPYNPACRCCVAGRKRDDQHRRRDKGTTPAQAELDAEGGASICADYFFPRDAPGKEGVTAVALCDKQSGWLAAHVVDNKGSGTKKAVDQILRDLRRMGHHGKVVVKTDQESAIIDLLRVVAQQRGEARTIFTTAARSDSKGNGAAEKAVQSTEEMVRTLMVDLEERCGEKLSVTEPFFEWLMEHACDLLNKCNVRKMARRRGSS